MTCPACGGLTAWVDEVSSDVCQTCGTLSDSSQYLLDSHMEAQPSTFQRDLFFPAPVVLKSTRSGNGVWSLPGQDDKAIRAAREEMAMRGTIEIITRKLAHSREFNRSFLLFKQAMASGLFRWGTKAACVAGVCISLALRESNQPDRLREIAYELGLKYPDVKYEKLSRTVYTVRQALGWGPREELKTEPRMFLTQIRSAIESSQLKLLKKVSISSAVELANTLCTFVDLGNLSAGPTACAIFIHAVEGVLRAEIPLGDVAKFLGSQFGFSGKTVQERYRMVQDVLVEEISKTPGMETDSRSKRRRVARNLKEIAQYRGLKRPRGEEEEERRPVKRRALPRPVHDAQKFLLNPLSNSLASPLPGRPPDHAPTLAGSLLACPSSSSMPTRLGVLVLEKGEECIEDEELFAEGELDGFIRTPAQVEAIMALDIYREWEQASRRMEGDEKDEGSCSEEELVTMDDKEFEEMVYSGWDFEGFEVYEEWS